MRHTFLKVFLLIGVMGVTSCYDHVFADDVSSTFPKKQSVTAYNQNFAVIKEVREIPLKKGYNQVKMDNVASLIDPTTVHFKSLLSPNSFQVLEQNYNYDLIDKAKILDKMVGKSIKFRYNNAVKEGILLNPSTNTVKNNNTGSYSYYNSGYQTIYSSSYAVKTDEGILITSLGDVIVDQLPDGLYPRPTLIWDLNSSKSGTDKVELAYMTDGINWYADYVALLDKDDKNLDLTAWVTLDNKAGVGYDNASLKLVAGDVRKIQDQNNLYATKAMAYDMEERSAAPQFKEESFFEYHLYTLDRTVDLKNNETKQLILTSVDRVPVTKKFIFDPLKNDLYRWISSGYSFYQQNKPGYGRDTAENSKVNVMVELENSKQNNLGIPLPNGKIRLYKADSQGDVQFIGEDSIDHTPKDEILSLYIGDAFDITGERKATSYKEDNSYIYVSFEFTLKNHKDTNVMVDVYDRLFGDWKIPTSSHPYQKKDAHTIFFSVPVTKNGTTKVTYSVKIEK